MTEIRIPIMSGSMPEQQVDAEMKSDLEKQAYRMAGNHSAVKVCGWTKKLIRNEGGCYKLKF